jgi:hypothetical protein
MGEKRNFLDISVDHIDNAVKTIVALNIAECTDRAKLEMDYPKLDKDFKSHVASIQNGDLKQIEAALYSQALILEDYFIRMLKKASVAREFNHIQILAQIALKTQNQCRTTLSALAEIKHPKRAVFIRQQNNAINQQVTNNESVEGSENISTSKNELLKEAIYEALDSGRTSEAIKVDTKLEAVERINWSENSQRKRN